MQSKLRISLGGTLILLAIFFGVVAAEIIVFLNTTSTTLLGLPVMIALFLGLALVFGFIGFYLFSEIIPEK